MESAIAEWLAFVRRNDSIGTAKQYRSILTRFRLHAGNRPIAEIVLADLEHYIDTLLLAHGHNTVNTHLVALKSFSTWRARRYSVPNLAAGVPFLTPDDPIQRVVSEGEYAAVLAVCNCLERDLIQLYGNTGLRRAEMLALRWVDIAPDLRALRVPKGKGNKARTVPCNATCRDVLTRNRADDSFLFLRRWGSICSQDRLCTRLAGRARIPAFGPHALRHYFATRMIKAGVAIKIVSKILGHSSIATTEKIYCHLMPVDLLGATDALPS